MSVNEELDLPSLTQAKLRSERIRILCMMGLFAAFVLLGLFRIVVPWNDKPSIGWLVFGMSIVYLASEAAMFRAVTGSLEKGRTLDRRLGTVIGLFECLYPIVVGFVLIVISPDERYTLLVSPAYAFLLILVAVSVLRVDWWATAFTGLFAAVGYAGLVVWVLASGSGPPSPHPPAMYVNLVVMNSLLVADLPEGRFVTLALLDVDAAAHDAHLLSAGHGPTLHVRGSDGEARQIDAQGLPLGLYDDPMLDEPVGFHLDPGDLVVLCSDGFFEPANPSGEAFGMERLIEVLRTQRHKSAAEIITTMELTVRQFMGSAPQPDDMTAVVVKRNA